MNILQIQAIIIEATYVFILTFIFAYFLGKFRWQYICNILQRQGTGTICVIDRARIKIKRDGSKEWIFKKFRKKYADTPIPDNNCVFPVQNWLKEKLVTFIETEKGNLIPITIDKESLKYVVDKYSVNAIKMTITNIAEKIENTFSSWKEKLWNIGVPAMIIIVAIVFASIITIMAMKGQTSQAIESGKTALQGVIPVG